MTAERASDEPGRMTIWEHLAELRHRIIVCLAAVCIGAVAGWFLYPYVLEILLVPYRAIVPDSALYATSPLEPFATRLRTAGYIGVALAMPVLLWQVWRFVTPGLHAHEKRYAVPFVASALVLFVVGATLAYLTLNQALAFLIEVGGTDIRQIYSPDSYLGLITYMMLAFGAGFEFPVLLVALQMLGILTPRQLLGWWRQSLVLVVVVAAVITPSSDPISLLALSVPMFILYLLAILVGMLTAKDRRQRRRAKKAAKAARKTERREARRGGSDGPTTTLDDGGDAGATGGTEPAGSPDPAPGAGTDDRPDPGPTRDLT